MASFRCIGNSSMVSSANSMFHPSNTTSAGNEKLSTQFQESDFPKFDGSNVKEWIYKCEKSFTIANTPEHDKIKLASSSLEGRAYIWHKAWMNPNPPHSWSLYAKAIFDRFGLLLEKDPMLELMEMKQKLTFEDYLEYIENKLLPKQEKEAMDVHEASLDSCYDKNDNLLEDELHENYTIQEEVAKKDASNDGTNMDSAQVNDYTMKIESSMNTKEDSLQNFAQVMNVILLNPEQILKHDESMQGISMLEVARAVNDHSSKGSDNDDILKVNIPNIDVKECDHVKRISFGSEAVEPDPLEMNYESIESEKLHNRGSIIAEYGTEEISAQVILPFHQNPDENEVEKEPLPPTLPRSHVHSSCKMLIASFQVHEENEFIVKKDDVDLIHVVEESANGTNEKGVLNLEKEIEIEEYEDGNEVVDQVDDLNEVEMVIDQVDDLNEVEMVIDYVDEANDMVLDECGAFNENDSVDGQYGLSNQEEEQNLQAHLSIDYYGDHNTVTHFQPSFQCSGASQFSYAHCEDGIAANRPSHALGSFEFGAKLVVINNVNSFLTSVDHGSQENGEMDYPVNRFPWEKSDHEVLLPMYIHDLVIDQNSPLASSDQGDYELGPIGGIFMPDTISCQEGTLVKTIRNGRIKLFLPYGWSPDDNWIDMPTAQDASNIPCQSLNEIYGIPCQGVNQFFFGMSGYIIWGWYYKDNGNSFGILIEKFKQELSQNLQFGEHPGRWMIEWKIAWLMLLGNFCMTRLYAEELSVLNIFALRHQDCRCMGSFIYRVYSPSSILFSLCKFSITTYRHHCYIEWQEATIHQHCQSLPFYSFQHFFASYNVHQLIWLGINGNQVVQRYIAGFRFSVGFNTMSSFLDFIYVHTLGHNSKGSILTTQSLNNSSILEDKDVQKGKGML